MQQRDCPQLSLKHQIDVSTEQKGIQSMALVQLPCCISTTYNDADVDEEQGLPGKYLLSIEMIIIFLRKTNADMLQSQLLDDFRFCRP
jgi:hypothetical protein